MTTQTSDAEMLAKLFAHFLARASDNEVGRFGIEFEKNMQEVPHIIVDLAVSRVLPPATPEKSPGELLYDTLNRNMTGDVPPWDKLHPSVQRGFELMARRS